MPTSIDRTLQPYNFGLQVAHPYPRVGGRRSDGGFWSGRASAGRAWQFSHLDYQDAGAAWGALTLDCDRRDSLHALTDLPPYSWLVRTDRGVHATWCLAAPVHKHATARTAPIRYLAAIAEYYAYTLDADPAFSGLARNPLLHDTHWGARRPWSLDELASVLPATWTRPKTPRTIAGRNHGLFHAGLRAASKHRDSPVLPMLIRMQSDICGAYPLPDSEVAGIARSIERYRTQWERRGHTPAFLRRQAARSKRGVDAIRARNADRDQAIITRRADGLSIRQLAAEFGISRTAIHHVLKRDST